MGILEIDGLILEKGGRRLIDNLNLDLWEGYVHAIVGPNGAGKSTLAYTIMGLEGYMDFEGEIKFEGKSLKGMGVSDRAKMGITLAWQEPARFEGLKVASFIMASAKEKKIDVIREALLTVGLHPDEYINRRVDKTLSGGERKKIELASILVMQPKLVMLDEPDSGIDVESLEKIFDVISILKERGTTIVLITHSPTVMRHAQHGFLLCHGQVIEKGVIEKILPYFEGKCIPCNHKNEPIIQELEKYMRSNIL